MTNNTNKTEDNKMVLSKDGIWMTYKEWLEMRKAEQD